MLFVNEAEYAELFVLSGHSVHFVCIVSRNIHVSVRVFGTCALSTGQIISTYALSARQIIRSMPCQLDKLFVRMFCQ
jgi:hypothetical protein